MVENALTDEQKTQLNLNYAVRMKHKRASSFTESKQEREARKQIEMGWRDTNRHITESVRYLNGGEAYAQIFLREFYPHEETYIPDGMRLTRERLDSAIEFLEAIRERVRR